MKEQNTGEVDALREENERLKTAPATPNEADREEARDINAIEADIRAHGVGAYLLMEFYIAARADAVKVERDGWKIIELPGPCDASCKHRWTSFEDMLEPCRSCKHLTSTERWVTVNTHYEPREVNLSDDREARNG